MKHHFAWPALALAFLFTILSAAPVLAQDDKAFIKYRQRVMKSQSANMGAIGDILKNKLPHGKNIAGHAKAINLTAKMIAAAFKKEITAGRTDSKGDIWRDWSKFEQAADKLARESAKLAQVAESGDMKAIFAQVKATGKACGGCHKNFRKKKKDRFKRK